MQGRKARRQKSRHLEWEVQYNTRDLLLQELSCQVYAVKSELSKLS